ncbi:MAG: hypothetical protein ACP5N3_03090 [Candidatus Nanoarchaeia archaeon]
MLENQLFEIDRKKAVEEPIKLPDSSFVTSLKSFGKDELYAGIIDIGSTTLAAAVLKEAARNKILPFVGPVVEKGIFLVTHVVDAGKIHKRTPKHVRQPYSFYLKQGLKEGSENLIKDLMFHDPIYMGVMWLGLHVIPKISMDIASIHMDDIKAPFLSIASYGLGIVGVAFIDMAKDKILYNRKINNMKDIGFQVEQYYESRFHIPHTEHPLEVIEKFQKQFGLGAAVTNEYHDMYFESSLKKHNGKTAKVRFRSRTRREAKASPNEEDEWLHTAQIIYTKAKEQKTKVDQARYFPVRKEKMYYILPEIKTQSIDALADGNLKIYLESIRAPEPYYRSISFERTMCWEKELLLCSDNVPMQRPYFILEFKVRNDLKLLREAMRFLMVEYPIVAVQTTHGKSDIFIPKA